MIAIILAVSASAESSIVYNGVKYTLSEDGNAVASAVKPKDPKLEILQIPNMLTVAGRPVTVTAIAKNGFKGCPNLKTAELPNTIKFIGADAFTDCKRLESVILPDAAKVEILPANFGFGGNGPFKGCRSLTSIRGNNVTLPDYALTDALRECYDVPVTHNLNKNNSVTVEAVFANSKSEVPAFSEFAESTVRQPMEIWEKRKPYESANAYKERVTDASRQAKLKDLLQEARSQYLARYAPLGISGRILYYDPDYNVFTIETNAFGEVYAKVPNDQAEAFEKKWNSVRITPCFGILNDNLAVLSCSFYLDGRTYETESTYTDETESGYRNMLRPLSELLAENTKGTPNVPESAQTAPTRQVVDQVDLQIPSTGVTDRKTFALVIGNEHYQGRIKGVPYAANDADIFARYCKKTLGLPEANVKLLTDATFGQIVNAIDEIKNKAKSLRGDARIIFYYSGHGKPDDKDHQAYIVPVDASPYNNGTNYSLSELYKQLAEADASLVAVFLDACFSGATRDDDMLVAARSVRMKPKEQTPTGNMVVFTAASDAETAFPLDSKGHGIFTYALLDKLQSTQGKVTLGELGDHICRTVTEISLSNNRPQNPKVLVSSSLPDLNKIQLRQ